MMLDLEHVWGYPVIGLLCSPIHISHPYHPAIIPDGFLMSILAYLTALFHALFTNYSLNYCLANS